MTTFDTIDSSLASPSTQSNGVHRATVTFTHEDGRCRLVLADGREAWATVLATAGTTDLRPGDTVLVACEAHAEEWFVLGSLRPDALTTRSGARARVVDDAGSQHIEVTDKNDAVVFRFDAETGRGTLTMPSGDLSMQAPDGDLELLAGRTLRLRSPVLQLQTARGEFQVREATWTGHYLLGRLKSLRLHCGQVHTVFGRLVERAKDVYQHVAGLRQLTAGRVRNLIRGDWTVRSDRTKLVAKDDVRIDGKKINLG